MRDADALLAIAEDVVGAARRAGADAAEAYVSESRRLIIACRGQFAAPRESHGVGVAVRVAVGQRVGGAGGSGLDQINRLVDEALLAARNSPVQSKFGGFAEPRDVLRPPTPVDGVLSDPDPRRMEDLAHVAVEAMRTPHTTFQDFTIATQFTRFAVCNSNGVAAWDQRGREVASMETRVSRGGEDRTARDTAQTPGPITDQVDVEAMARRLGERVVGALGAQPLDGPVDAVVFGPGPAGQMAKLFAQGLSGSLVEARQSVLAGRQGEPVASPAVTLLDAPNGDTQMARVDHEGTPIEDLVLVEDGRLRTYLHDWTSGSAAGGQANGRGVRASEWMGGVGIQPIHLGMRPGRATLEDLFDGGGRAVYVTDPLAGMFTANATTGDFSVVTPYALLVEGGEVVRTLPHTTLGGNVHEVMQAVVDVGRDLFPTASGSFPALRATGVSCAT